MCGDQHKYFKTHIFIYMRKFKDRSQFLCIYFLFISTHTFFVCTWNIWICLPVFIKSNRSKPWKTQCSSTHLSSFRGHISFMSVYSCCYWDICSLNSAYLYHTRVCLQGLKSTGMKKACWAKTKRNKRAWNPARFQGPVILSFRLLIPWSLQCWALEIWLFFPRKSWKFRSYYPR